MLAYLLEVLPGPQVVALTGAGLERVWQHSRAHRFFAVTRWSSDTVGLALTDSS